MVEGVSHYWAGEMQPTLMSLSPKTIAVSIAPGLLLLVSYFMRRIRKGRINASRKAIAALIP
jgi:hypothetical protein